MAISYEAALTGTGKFLIIPTLISLPELFWTNQTSAGLSGLIAFITMFAALSFTEEDKKIGFKGTFFPLISWISMFFLCIGRMTLDLSARFSIRKIELSLALCVYGTLFLISLVKKCKIYLGRRRAIRNYSTSGE